MNRSSTGVRGPTLWIPRHGFEMLDVRQMEALPAVEWLVYEMIPSGGLSVLYGEPELGKTFVTLDLALSLGTGLPWLDIPALGAPVLYVSAEGSAGLPQRIHAWRQQHPTARPPDVHFIRQPLSLLESTVDDLVASTRECGARLVIIDTLSRCMPGGEENWTKDMGRAIAGVDRVRHRTGAAVLLVHHTLKTGEGARKVERGSSVLRGAADTMMLLARHSSGLRLECTKQKDAERFTPVGLQLVTVDVEQGTSCVVAPRTEPVVKDDPIAMTPGARKIMHVLADSAGVRLSGHTIATAAELSGSTFEREVKKLRALGLVEADRHGYALTGDGRSWIAERRVTFTVISPSFHPHEGQPPCPPSPSSPSHPFRGEGEGEGEVAYKEAA